MSHINSIALSGQLTRDPELRTAGSSEVCKFTLATERSYKKKDSDEWESVTTFTDCEAWGHLASLLDKKLRKGDLVAVHGRLDYDTWENSEGQKRSKLKVTVDTADGQPFFRKADGSDTPERSESDAASQPNASTDSAQGTLPSDDDIPF